MAPVTRSGATIGGLCERPPTLQCGPSPDRDVQWGPDLIDVRTFPLTFLLFLADRVASRLRCCAGSLEGRPRLREELPRMDASSYLAPS
jgi:hypothetical protein